MVTKELGIERNPHIAALTRSYLFAEIEKRKAVYLNEHPQAKLINLGIGDTTHPLTPDVTHALMEATQKLGLTRHYKGYGPSQGEQALRKAISEIVYMGKISPDEIFISDGTKGDIFRLQVLFGNRVSISVQDPAYPVYVMGSQIIGVQDIQYLPCDESNHFFPDLDRAKRTDLIYFCSPNNPTGSVLKRDQLSQLISKAQENKSILIYDTAYSAFIQDPSIPKSPYEVEGAKECVIEAQSFSKFAGFTGVRLGWTVIPKDLQYSDGGEIHRDFKTLYDASFNGASNISQAGGIVALKAFHSPNEATSMTMENAKILRHVFLEKGYSVNGGDHAPYVWVKFPEIHSWEAFEMLLNSQQIIAIPGSGFGPAGEGYLRFSAFGKREDVLEAAMRINRLD